ncbi:enterochelin esterase [Pantoea piersonii]|uniref:enterochelin esterase n=1 Tax=Pantoea piersonii TaxID=2364647 RepID=UPI0022F19F70|nr:enterochelin esterase [Pantoea piersonii]WBV23556.1 enterochelin esterase [Pantoea piersonii]
MVPFSAGAAAALLAENEAGSQAWWQLIAEIGTPIVEETSDASRLKLTFFWRDPQGNKIASSICRVYLDINGVTNHHSFSPVSLKRLPGSDIWTGSVQQASDWRGSYSLIPIGEAQLPPQPKGTPEQQCNQQRAWWRSLFPFAIADPLNPCAPHGNARGVRLSGIHLPEALSQQAWLAVDAGRAPEVDEKRFRLEWNSTRLGNRRRCWLWRPEEAEEADLPLVVVLDGQNWAISMSLLPVLEQQTRQGDLPAAAWLMIDAIDDVTRSREQACNADFWLAVQEELLPLAKEIAPFTDDPASTVVAGQSYGGLAALYAGLNWPQRFGCVLTQSGSFWWPNMKFMTHYEAREQHEKGYLTQQVSRRPNAVPLRIFQEAGLLEQDILFVNQQMRQALLEAGHKVHYRSYHGGHDVLCWRGGLTDGVCWLLGQHLMQTRQPDPKAAAFN